MRVETCCDRVRLPPGSAWLRPLLLGGLLAGSAAGACAQTYPQFSPQLQPQRSQQLARTPEPAARRVESTSTAFFVDNSGHMLTARHAVESCVRVIVAKEGFAVTARVVALAGDADLALVKVSRTLGLSAVFPQTVKASANEMVFASAFDTLPGKLIGGGVMANATVKADSTPATLAIVSDVTFGASGAPVLDSRGLVQGIVSKRTAANRVVAVGASEAKSFLRVHNVRLQEDDRPQIAGNGSRAHRAASISARVRCLQS